MKPILVLVALFFLSGCFNNSYQANVPQYTPVYDANYRTVGHIDSRGNIYDRDWRRVGHTGRAR